MSRQIELTPGHISKLLSAIDAGLVKGLGRAMPGHMCVEAAVCFALGLPHGDDPRCVSPAIRSLVIRVNDAEWPSPQARAVGMRRLALAQLGSRGVIDDAEFATRLADMAAKTIVPKVLRNAASGHPDSKHRDALRQAADRCETDGATRSADADDVVRDADCAAYAAYAAAPAAGADQLSRAFLVTRSAGSAVTNAANAVFFANEEDSAGNCIFYAVSSATGVFHAAVGAGIVATPEFTESVVQILIDMKAPGCEWLEMS